MMVKLAGKTPPYEIQKLIHYFCNKKEFLQQWKEAVSVPIYEEDIKIDLIIVKVGLYGYYKFILKFYPTFFLKLKFVCVWFS